MSHHDRGIEGSKIQGSYRVFVIASSWFYDNSTLVFSFNCLGFVHRNYQIEFLCFSVEL